MFNLICTTRSSKIDHEIVIVFLTDYFFLSCSSMFSLIHDNGDLTFSSSYCIDMFNLICTTRSSKIDHEIVIVFLTD